MTTAVRMFTASPVARCPAAPRSRAAVCRAARETWYPGAEPPSYLDGSLPGDRGFDPLRFGSNTDVLPWYFEAERYNGRMAMLAVAGILFTDAVGLPKWYNAGAEKYALDTTTLLVIELAVWAVFEYKRYGNIKKYGQGGVLGMVPFDPAGLNSDKMAEREIKNGRLAMIAFLGIASQAAVRGEGPIQNLKDHIADPGHVNIYTSKVGPEATAAVIMLAFAPIIVEAYKRVGEGEDEFNPIPW